MTTAEGKTGKKEIKGRNIDLIDEERNTQRLRDSLEHER
jgi:hypothetical protein